MNLQRVKVTEWTFVALFAIYSRYFVIEVTLIRKQIPMVNARRSLSKHK